MRDSVYLKVKNAGVFFNSLEKEMKVSWKLAMYSLINSRATISNKMQAKQKTTFKLFFITPTKGF